MFSINKIKGLIAAPFTPMHGNGDINPELVPAYYSFLEKNGVAGTFINGSTGEGVSLTQKEKHIMAEEWGKCLRRGGTVPVISLVGGTSYRECIENAIASKESGLSAIAVLGPYYFKPSGPGQLAEFIAAIGESVPDMPVYYYHIPVLSGVSMPMADFLGKIGPMLPNFAGIKYTHEDFLDFLLCLHYENGKYDMLWGRDENLLPALSLGCHGAVGSTYNYAAPLYHAIIKAFDEGRMEEARQLQHKAVKMVLLLGKYGGIATGKAFMKYVGLDCGKFRLPIKNMAPGEYDVFKNDVDNLGLEEYFSVL